MSVSQVVSNPQPFVGEQFSYQVTVTNNGPDPATSVAMQDSLPSLVRLVSLFGTGCSHDGSPTGGVVTCSVASIPSGGSGNVVINVEAVSEGAAPANASVDAAEADPDLSNNSSSAGVFIQRQPPPPSADLRVQQTRSTATPRQGDVFSYTISVTNDGPAMASNVRLTDTLPAGVDFVRVEAPIPCSHAKGIVTCSIPQFPPGFSGSGEIFVRAVRDGPITNTVSASSGTPDSNTANNLSSLAGAILPPPPPVAGKSVNVRVLSGKVFIKPRAGAQPAQATGFRRLKGAEQIRVGSLVDARKGRVRMTAAADRRGGTATGDFDGAVFRVAQKATRRPITDLRLTGGNFARCGSASGASAAAARRIRRLRGSARGRFRTRGRHSAATVRGTKWFVEDRCDGTLTKVQSGKVVVRDFARRRNVTLRKGQRYLARSRRG